MEGDRKGPDFCSDGQTSASRSAIIDEMVQMRKSHPQPQLRARCILNDSIPSLEIHQKATGMSEPAIASICSRTTLHFPLRHHLPSPSSTMTTLSIRCSSRSGSRSFIALGLFTLVLSLRPVIEVFRRRQILTFYASPQTKPRQYLTCDGRCVLVELVWMRSFWVGVENVVSEEKMNRVQGTEGDRKETGTSLGSGQ
ncbi:hypothetical protein D9758_015973 [Tetrapyrgos nigripes]|uniref:Uncharacterized protein n=1 Tax=Tetrapyrgos nigripes TaxID=182062 RepID=A0A8H5FDM3_9AGAR|nr:hypothetical protein D9758_015973 [Tetrapyrgos nigripes]